LYSIENKAAFQYARFIFGSPDLKVQQNKFMKLLVHFILVCFTLAVNAKTKNMENTNTQTTDKETLSVLNAQFIQNFLKQDVKAHSGIIHPDFVCIESNGAIISRETYLQNWATDHDNSGYTSFSYTDEHIRIFGNTALVRAKTIYTKNVDGKTVTGYTIYTDTYLKENGKWKCIQVQITPVKK
jgi:ketosteroid isomerase-like protein